VVEAAWDSASKKFVSRPISVVGAFGGSLPDISISGIGGTLPDISATAVAAATVGLIGGDGGITGKGDVARLTLRVFTRNILLLLLMRQRFRTAPMCQRSTP